MGEKEGRGERGREERRGTGGERLGVGRVKCSSQSGIPDYLHEVDLTSVYKCPTILVGVWPGHGLLSVEMALASYDFVDCVGFKKHHGTHAIVSQSREGSRVSRKSFS